MSNEIINKKQRNNKKHMKQHKKYMIVSYIVLSNVDFMFYSKRPMRKKQSFRFS